MRFSYEHVRQIGKCRAIGNRTSEPHLFSSPIEADGDRIIDSTLEEIARNVARPITFLEKTVNHIQIQKTPVVGDEKVSICPIMWHGLHPI